jgi:hypothetical protein
MSHNPDLFDRDAAEAYEAFEAAKRGNDKACACKYGHMDCSDREGGRCCDEYFHSLPYGAKVLVSGSEGPF